MNSMLAVDPGLQMGWAYFPEGKKYPTKAGLIKPMTKGKDFFVQLHSTIAQFASLLIKFSPRDTAVEWPSYFSSLGGRATAGSGSLVKLTFGIGKLAQIVEAYGSNFVPVPVNKWKGQLSKRIVEKRIRRILPVAKLKKLKPEKDVWDAIGIGLYMRGLFK